MIDANLEAILFSAAKPLSVRTLASVLEMKPAQVEEALERLNERYSGEGSGIRLVRAGSEVQIMTGASQSELVRNFLEAETTGELTRPQLETLTVVAYREPITKAELEQIRGVNCSMILRNLMMRGLVEAEDAREKLAPCYHTTHEFLRFLGITKVSELPDYATLHADANLVATLAAKPPEQHAA